MNENVINSLFCCFDQLQKNNSLMFYGLLVKKTHSLVFYLQALEHK